MKIHNGQTKIPRGGDGETFSVVGLINLVLGYSGKPGAGINGAEQRKRDKIAAKCFVDEDETIEREEVNLTAEQLITVRTLANDFPWGIRHKDIVRFLDILDAADKSEEKVEQEA